MNFLKCYSDGDIVLHYTYGELTPVLKRVPWFTDNHKLIQAICFDPSATWLLVVCMYIYRINNTSPNKSNF